MILGARPAKLLSSPSGCTSKASLVVPTEISPGLMDGCTDGLGALLPSKKRPKKSSSTDPSKQASSTDGGLVVVNHVIPRSPPPFHFHVYFFFVTIKNSNNMQGSLSLSLSLSFLSSLGHCVLVAEIKPDKRRRRKERGRMGQDMSMSWIVAVVES